MHQISALVYKEKRRPIGRSYWKSYRLVIDKSGFVILTSANGERTKARAHVHQVSTSIRLCKSKELHMFRNGKTVASLSNGGYLLMITLASRGVRSNFEDTKLAFDSQSELFSWLHSLVALLQARNGMSNSELNLTSKLENGLGSYLKESSRSSTDVRVAKEYDPFWPMHSVAWPSIWKHFQSYAPLSLDAQRKGSICSEINRTTRSNSAPTV